MKGVSKSVQVLFNGIGSYDNGDDSRNSDNADNIAKKNDHNIGDYNNNSRNHDVISKDNNSMITVAIILITRARRIIRRRRKSYMRKRNSKRASLQQVLPVVPLEATRTFAGLANLEG